MKFKQTLMVFLGVLGFFSITFQFAAPVFGQSGRVISKKPRPAVKTSTTEATLQKDDCTQTGKFQYVVPTDVQNFIRAVNKSGACGYRLERAVSLPDVKYEDGVNVLAVNQTGTLKVAGMMVRVSPDKYDYEALRVEPTIDLAEKLNAFSEQGFLIHQIVSFDGTFTEKYDRETERVLRDERKYPQIKNLIIFERAQETPTLARRYRVFKAGYGLGKKPTEKMQSLVDEGLKENFRPVEIFLSTGFGSEKPFDSYHAVIAEKTDDPPGSEIRYVRAWFVDTFMKEVDELAAAGYRIGKLRATHGILYKPEKTAQPVKYRWISPGGKTFPAAIVKAGNDGSKFVGAAASTVTYHLVFEENAAQNPQFEYKVVAFGKPQQLRIQSLDELRRLPPDGFAFKELFFNGSEVMALFERAVK